MEAKGNFLSTFIRIQYSSLMVKKRRFIMKLREKRIPVRLLLL
jgi:hypothetical protein